MKGKLSMLFMHDAASVCETLAHEAVASGDEARLVLSPRGLTTYPDLRDRTRITKAGRLDVIESYAASLASEDYDVAVASSRWSWVLAAAAKKLAGKKLVVVLQGSDIRRLPAVRRTKKALFTKSLKAADHIFYTSPDNREAAEAIGVPCSPLPNPIDLDIFSPAGPAEHLEGDPSVFVPTRFDIDKGTDTLTGLARRVLDGFARSRLYLVAWSKAREGPRELLSKSKGRVVELDFMSRRDMPRFYRGTSVLIGQANLGICSMTELEAMACGEPVAFYDKYVGYGAAEPGVEPLFDFFQRMVTDETFRRRKVQQGLEMIAKVHDSRKVYSSFRDQILKTA